VRAGIILVAFEVLLNKVYQLYRIDALSRKDFNTVYRADIFVGFLTLVVIAATIYYLSIFSVFLAPIIGNLVYIYLYKRKYSLSFRFNESTGLMESTMVSTWPFAERLMTTINRATNKPTALFMLVLFRTKVIN